eukprot:TRINITY_DN12236_c0_g2_i1.p1 TRINITY_DN12236_c0_g2~~TRINITY_DN12236_c0_g2_i1.p1  ORF type:complete len:185 (+),score=23.01 TRINITY_DN12236_c0_g2_i1:172-726(+)
MGLYLINFFTQRIVFGASVIQIIFTIIIKLILISKFSNVKLIGLTGGIGCGKSTCSEVIQQTFKIPVIDCDLLSRQIMEVGKPAYKKVVSIFGESILNPDKTIDRKKLGEVVFSNRSAKGKLMRVTNWYIFKALFGSLYQHIFVKGQKTILIDAPILYETRILEFICYPIIVVYVTDELSLIHI